LLSSWYKKREISEALIILLKFAFQEEIMAQQTHEADREKVSLFQIHGV